MLLDVGEIDLPKYHTGRGRLNLIDSSENTLEFYGGVLETTCRYVQVLNLTAGIMNFSSQLNFLQNV